MYIPQIDLRQIKQTQNHVTTDFEEIAEAAKQGDKVN